MSWPSGNVPPAVSALRDMLVASASFTAAGMVQANVHYPEVDFASAAAVPCCLIVQEDETRTTYAAGSGALPTGVLRVDVYENALVGDVEKLAYGIASDLGASTTGLLIRSARCGMSSDPKPAETAATDDGGTFRFRIVHITIEFGPTI